MEKINVESVLSGGFGGSTEARVLDWEDREVDDKVFGPLVTKTRRIKVEELDNDWLKEGWLDTAKEHGLIQTSGRSDTSKTGRTWLAEMVCIDDGCDVENTCSFTARHGASKRSKVRRSM